MGPRKDARLFVLPTLLPFLRYKEEGVPLLKLALDEEARLKAVADGFSSLILASFKHFGELYFCIFFRGFRAQWSDLIF